MYSAKQMALSILLLSDEEKIYAWFERTHAYVVSQVVEFIGIHASKIMFNISNNIMLLLYKKSNFNKM